MTKNEKKILYLEAQNAGFEGSFMEFEDQTKEFVPFTDEEKVGYEEACLTGLFKGSLADYRKFIEDKKQKKEVK